MPMLAVMEKLDMAFAVDSRVVGTRFGIDAITAGRKNELTMPVSTPDTTSAATFAPTAPSTARKAKPRQRAATPSRQSPMTISRLRE